MHKIENKLKYALKEASDEKLAQKEKKIPIAWIPIMDGQNIPKLETLKRTACLNMQQLRE